MRKMKPLVEEGELIPKRVTARLSLVEHICPHRTQAYLYLMLFGPRIGDFKRSSHHIGK